MRNQGKAEANKEAERRQMLALKTTTVMKRQYVSQKDYGVSGNQNTNGSVV